MNNRLPKSLIQISIYILVFSITVIMSSANFINSNNTPNTRIVTEKSILSDAKTEEEVLGITIDQVKDPDSILTSDQQINNFIKVQEEIKYSESTEEIYRFIVNTNFDDIIEEINSIEL